MLSEENENYNVIVNLTEETRVEEKLPQASAGAHSTFSESLLLMKEEREKCQNFINESKFNY